MASKTWRLVVTELGSSTALSEVAVDAVNWMTALKLGRQEIGEDGGVPTGASCAVAPDGKVTIHDPLARRTYTLVPDAAKSLKRSSPAGPRVPADSVPPSPSTPEAAKQPEPAKQPEAPAKKPPKRTVAYNINDLKDLPKPPANIGAPPSSPPKPASVPAPAPASVPPAPAPAAPKPSSIPPPATASAPPAPASAPPAPAPASAPPASASAPPVAPAPSTPPRPTAEATEGDNWNLLDQRSEDPSGDSPLHYRERTYVMAPGTSAEDAEFLLRERFGALRSGLDDDSNNKFFNLAVFDHRWQGRPEKAPLATLQWKDWRGEPQLAFPAREIAQRQIAAAAAKAAAPKAAPAAPAPTAAAPPAPTPAAPTPKPAAPSPAPQAPAPQQAQAQAQPQAQAPRKRRGRTQTSEQDARLAHAFEASQDLFFLSTPVEGLEFIVKLLDELIPCEAMSACLYDINTDEFRFVTLRGPGGEQRRGEAVPRETGLIGAAVQKVGVALRVNNVSSDERFDPGVDGRVDLEAKSVLYMPLNHEGRLLGVLQLINRKVLAEFTTADMDVIAYIGKQTAEFLYQARISLKDINTGTG